MQQLVITVTSLDKVPPLGLSRKVEVEFSNNSNQAFFAETCSMVLKVPTLHGSLEVFQETFLEVCDRPLVFSRNGCHYHSEKTFPVQHFVVLEEET